MTTKTQPIQIREDKYCPIEPQSCNDLLLQCISSCRNIEWRHVCLFLSYNVISFPQLALICGVGESTLRNLSVKRESSLGFKSTLNACNPFPDTKGGKLFVMVDKACKIYIVERLVKTMEQNTPDELTEYLERLRESEDETVEEMVTEQ